MTSMADWGLHLAPDWRPVTLTETMAGAGPARGWVEEPVSKEQREAWALAWRIEARERRARMGLPPWSPDDVPESV